MKPSQRAELLTLAQKLIALANSQTARCEGHECDPLLAAAQREIARRRSRQSLFVDRKLNEVGWAILLDLFVMEAHGRRVGITSAVIAGGSPATTGLRYVSLLIEGGLIVRIDDHTDGRRAFVQLTRKGKEFVQEAMRRSLDAEELPRDSANPRSLGRPVAQSAIIHDLNIDSATFEAHRRTMLKS